MKKICLDQQPNFFDKIFRCIMLSKTYLIIHGFRSLWIKAVFFLFQLFNKKLKIQEVKDIQCKPRDRGYKIPSIQDTRY